MNEISRNLLFEKVVKQFIKSYRWPAQNVVTILFTDSFRMLLQKGQISIQWRMAKMTKIA